MRTNLSEESLDVLGQAKKASICMMDPVVKEELIFRALITIRHPLWLIIMTAFELDENRIKNLLTNELLGNESDSPDIPENLKKQNAYFERAHSEAKKDAAHVIEPVHLVRAIFSHASNDVIKVLTDAGVVLDTLRDFLRTISYTDLVHAITANRPPAERPPSSHVLFPDHQAATAPRSEAPLAHFGRNLNALAREGKLDPVYFRDEEIHTTIEILCRKQQNNPLLVGDAGVGKTAIAEGIAQMLVAGTVPEHLRASEVMELNITSLVAGTTYRGQFEDRIQNIIEYCAANPHIILFIDELHMIVGAGGEKGLSDAANIFKPALARGSLRCIGATTTKEYHQFIDKDKALKRRFQSVFVTEPNRAQAVEIIMKCRNRYELYHGVRITDEAIRSAVAYADEYIKDKHFPGKALDVLDHTCAREKIDPRNDMIVTPEEVAGVVAKIAQVPITHILGDRSQELSLLAQRLKERVIGQDEAIKDLLDLVYLIKMGMFIDACRPEGVIMFAGPTGVGKNEMARSLTKALLGDESRLITFDMTEFKDASSVNRLIGAAPGYVGYEHESRLVGSIRSHPNSVILLDGIEEAHPDVLSVLEQIFKKGTLSTQSGEQVFFSHATFILITNLAAEALRDDALQGLPYPELCRTSRVALTRAIHGRFNQDFLNTVDKIIYFDHLQPDWMNKIVDEKMRVVLQRLASQGVTVTISDTFKQFLISKTYSMAYGAKMINRSIEQELLKPLAKHLLSCDSRAVAVDVSDSMQIVLS